MKIILNHVEESFDGDEITITEIIKVKKFTHHDLILKINGTLIRHNNWDSLTVREGDNVEIIHLFHGG